MRYGGGCKRTPEMLLLQEGAVYLDLEQVRSDGHTLLLDGTNASDDAGDRPGMQALRELEVRSPLRECGITKEEVRRRSKEAGIFTWNKPRTPALPRGFPPECGSLRKI